MLDAGHETQRVVECLFAADKVCEGEGVEPFCKEFLNLLFEFAYDPPDTGFRHARAVTLTASGKEAVTALVKEKLEIYNTVNVV